MDVQPYAFLDEVWGSDAEKSSIANPACELLNKNGNMQQKQKQSIMDAYMAEQECPGAAAPQLTFEARRPPTYDISQVQGYNSMHPSYAQQYGVDEYFTDELKTPPGPAPEPLAPAMQESAAVAAALYPTQEEALSREAIYKNIVEKYSSSIGGGGGRKSDQYYVELFVYLISGVFLIFFMEQILQVGAKLSKR